MNNDSVMDKYFNSLNKSEQEKAKELMDKIENMSKISCDDCHNSGIGGEKHLEYMDNIDRGTQSASMDELVE